MMIADESSNSRSPLAQNSHALSPALNVLKFFMRVDKSFLFLSLTLDNSRSRLAKVDDSR